MSCIMCHVWLPGLVLLVVFTDWSVLLVAADVCVSTTGGVASSNGG